MPFDVTLKRPGFAGSKPAALGFAFAAVSMLATSGALAQETVIIGGGPPARPISGGVPPSTVGSGAGGIVVNDAVLDSLGPGPAAGLPMAAPRMPVYGAGIATPGASGSYTTPGAGGALGAYRAPGTGELVVTRPSTLLYPPMQAPKSRLAVAPTRRAATPKPAQPDRTGTAALPGGKLTSRLIAAPPKKPPAARPAKPASVPEMPAAPAKTALSTTAPAKPSVPAPPPPSLLARTQDDTAGQVAAKAPPAVAASIPPAPKIQAPSPPPAALMAPSDPAPSVPTPKVMAPKVTAPAIPGAPTAKPAETTVAAIPPAKDRAVARPGGELRLTFNSGSAELSDAAKKQLTDLAQNLAQKSSERVQLLAFAADGGGGASQARRLSLSRALAVRAFLIDKGVRSTRMDVRALGSKAGDGPADRVDILPR